MTQPIEQNQRPPFNPNDHITKLKTKDYLEVKWRLVWFRDKYPHGIVKTDIITLDLDKGFALFKAHIEDGEGGIGEGHGSESVKDFSDYIEKAETKAQGRALAALGYGTQFAPEWSGDAPDNPVDSPVERSQPQGQENGENRDESSSAVMLQRINALQEKFAAIFPTKSKAPDFWDAIQARAFDPDPVPESYDRSALNRLIKYYDHCQKTVKAPVKPA